MKLSGHSYNNDVFESLLDGLKGDVEYTGDKMEKTAGKVYTVSGSDVFSSNTEQDFLDVQDEQVQVLASELAFAADRAKVALTREHLAQFVEQVNHSEDCRGKKLERAAQKFCSNVVADTAPPRGTTRMVNAIEDFTHNSAVTPAGYDPKYGPGDSKTGGFMGMSKNPNTIWDTEAMDRLASTISGDEQIKASKDAQEQFTKDQKQAYWQGIQDKMSEKGIILEKVASVANVSTKEEIGNQNLPANSMSIFSDDRDFNNIPAKTDGETIAALNETRATKKADASDEWNHIKASKKADDRSAVDRMFDGLADNLNKD